MEVEMASETACVVDNRDAQEVYGYLEARVESLKRRIKELEKENEMLRQMLVSEGASLSKLEKSA
jgi:cell division protein FtsB